MVAAGWMAGATVTLLGARAAATDGANELRALRRDVGIEELGTPDTADRLAAAVDDLGRAEARIGHPVLWPLRVVPVASRHVRAAERAVGAGTRPPRSRSGRPWRWRS